MLLPFRGSRWKASGWLRAWSDSRNGRECSPLIHPVADILSTLRLCGSRWSSHQGQVTRGLLHLGFERAESETEEIKGKLLCRLVTKNERQADRFACVYLRKILVLPIWNDARSSCVPNTASHIS